MGETKQKGSQANGQEKGTRAGRNGQVIPGELRRRQVKLFHTQK
jgi:hypothetical protein